MKLPRGNDLVIWQGVGIHNEQTVPRKQLKMNSACEERIVYVRKTKNLSDGTLAVW
jgi:hypothetical protein